MPSKKTHLSSAKPEANPPVVPGGILDDLEGLESQTLVLRPPNSFTIMEYARKRGFHRNKAANIVYRWEQTGKVKRHKGEGSNRVYFTLVQKRTKSEAGTEPSK